MEIFVYLEVKIRFLFRDWGYLKRTWTHLLFEMPAQVPPQVLALLPQLRDLLKSRSLVTHNERGVILNVTLRPVAEAMEEAA